MNAKSPPLLLAAVLVFLASATCLPAADSDAKPVAKVAILRGVSDAGARSAILQAALGRKWTVVKDGQNEIVINLAHRGYDSTLTLRIDENNISVYSDSWTVNRKGEKKKRKEPTGWIDNLTKDISVFMAREL